MEDMCGAQHPFYKFLCLRNPDHKGQHWFTTRWEDGTCIYCRRSSDLLLNGICGTCGDELMDAAKAAQASDEFEAERRAE